MTRDIKFRAEYQGAKYEVETREPKRADHKGFYKQHGYIKRLVTEHPFSDRRGYVAEHRLVVEENLGSFLPRSTVIHHKNSIRDDNRLENLEIIQEQSIHSKKHDSGERNSNGRFITSEPIFDEIKIRLFNKNTGLIQTYCLSKLINTTFRRSQFEFRGRFTGLKDKNGVEIYEGDLVQFLEWKPKEIVFQDKAFAGFTLKGTDLFLTTYDVELMTVIGNVYETESK